MFKLKNYKKEICKSRWGSARKGSKYGSARKYKVK